MDVWSRIHLLHISFSQVLLKTGVMHAPGQWVSMIQHVQSILKE